MYLLIRYNFDNGFIDLLDLVFDKIYYLFISFSLDKIHLLLREKRVVLSGSVVLCCNSMASIYADDFYIMKIKRIAKNIFLCSKRLHK